MEIKKGQVWECLISFEDWIKGENYLCGKDGYLYNSKSEQESISSSNFLKHHFKLVGTIDMEEEKQNNTPHYYDNGKGSIYLFCHNQKLNSWESDIIKRVVRCRKKGLFAEDLQKTKNLIDLYLKEFNHEK